MINLSTNLAGKPPTAPSAGLFGISLNDAGDDNLPNQQVKKWSWNGVRSGLSPGCSVFVI
jgi:hypothetical protein